MFAGDERKLGEVEDQVADEIDAIIKAKKAQEESDKKGRRQRHKRATPAGIATDNEVNAAMGQRLKPTAQQAPQVKAIGASKKAAAVSQQSAMVRSHQCAL